jgi:hypothetical protein
MTSRTVLLWNTHVWYRELEAEFEKFLNLEYPGSPEVWLILDSGIPLVNEIAKKYQHCIIIDEKDLFKRLSYPLIEGRGILHHSHFPLLDFYLSHQQYDHYWFIEFDVRYTGEWEFFLRSFESFDHDLITSHIRHFGEEPSWPWWDTLYHPAKMIDRNQYLRSFNVIFRISNHALGFIHHEQRDGWRGFNEVSLPTLLHTGGYRIMDFGGDGDFTLPNLRNRVYTSHGLKNGLLSPFCTMRWRPSSNHAGLHRDKLYHSIKPRPMVEPVQDRLSYIYTWIKDFIYFNIARMAL